MKPLGKQSHTFFLLCDGWDGCNCLVYQTIKYNYKLWIAGLLLLSVAKINDFFLYSRVTDSGK